MKISYIFAESSDIGLLILTGKGSMESWLFYDQEAGRAVLYKCNEEEDEAAVNECRNLIASSGLPEESDDEPACVEGFISETIQRLVDAICQGSHCEPKLTPHFRMPPPLLCFLFAPRREDKQSPSSLLGLRDDVGNHSVFVIYSKVQGRQILKTYSARVNSEQLKRFMDSLERHDLPEDSDMPVVRISDPLAYYMNRGYAVVTAQMTAS